MKHFKLCIIILSTLFITACNVTKHVPNGEYLLDKVRLHPDVPDISKTDLEEYLRQTPNAKVFGLFSMQLGIYNLAGKDSSRNINKAIKRMGTPPVIYDNNLTDISTQQLTLLYENKGYVNTTVDSKVKFKGKKAYVDYYIHTNKPYRIRKYNIGIQNDLLRKIAADTSRSQIRPGMLFDVDQLDAERLRITTRLRNDGFYNFNKEFLTYTADSTLRSHQVDITLNLRDYIRNGSDSVKNLIFKRYKINRIVFYTEKEEDIAAGLQNLKNTDTTRFKEFTLISPKKKFISLDALVHNTYLNANTYFSDKAVEKTYGALNSLGAIKYVNINFKTDQDSLLNCNITIVPAKNISFSSEVEGTYTDGYWGGATKLNLVNKNAFKGAETLTGQANIAYEWQKGIWQRELGGQIGLKIPKFVFPVGSYNFKRNMHASTEFNTNLSYQFRPSQFAAGNVGAGMNYVWDRTKYHHSFQLFNLSYMDFTLAQPFIDTYITTGLYNKYNYENRFILKMGYNGSFSNYNPNRPLKSYSTFKYSIETAGNLFYGIDKFFNITPSSDGTYKLFGIRYAQYVRAEYNSTYYQIFDKNNRFVYHLGFGLGIPYGNADLIPYERRFYSGGANSVRGWNESTLGPGSYKSTVSSYLRDYNQVGDIKLDMNMEYRVKLFYVFEGALFLDGGNIWTIKNYKEQPGGVFKFDTFLNQIAIAYGAGLRMDFSFFIARFDLGFKLYDPAQSRLHEWQLGSDFSSRDLAFHIAIGYPF